MLHWMFSYFYIARIESLHLIIQVYPVRDIYLPLCMMLAIYVSNLQLAGCCLNPVLIIIQYLLRHQNALRLHLHRDNGVWGRATGHRFGIIKQ